MISDVSLAYQWSSQDDYHFESDLSESSSEVSQIVESVNQISTPPHSPAEAEALPPSKELQRGVGLRGTLGDEVPSCNIIAETTPAFSYAPTSSSDIPAPAVSHSKLGRLLSDSGGALFERENSSARFRLPQHLDVAPGDIDMGAANQPSTSTTHLDSDSDVIISDVSLVFHWSSHDDYYLDSDDSEYSSEMSAIIESDVQEEIEGVMSPEEGLQRCGESLVAPNDDIDYGALADTESDTESELDGATEYIVGSESSFYDDSASEVGDDEGMDLNRSGIQSSQANVPSLEDDDGNEDMEYHQSTSSFYDDGVSDALSKMDCKQPELNEQQDQDDVQMDFVSVQIKDIRPITGVGSGMDIDEMRIDGDGIVMAEFDSCLQNRRPIPGA
ncbi:hypothetical protein PM082_004565 [Marasmius tenuissimus]|nr:hypothetical protein PM082_004565 [Marasmius tenuissimus]